MYCMILPRGFTVIFYWCRGMMINAATPDAPSVTFNLYCSCCWTMSATPSLRRKRRLPQKPLRSPLYNPDGRDRERAEPFYVTFLKTGSTILLLCTVIYLVFVVRASFSYQHSDELPYREHFVVKHAKEEPVEDDGKVTTLPQFSLPASSERDAFGIAEKFFSDIGESAPNEVQQFLDAAKTLRTEFAQRYGGEVSARALLDRSLVVLKKDESIDIMAQRIQTARKTSGIFQMAVGGNAAAAGCGNFFHQSFPFVVERLLADPFELLGLTLQVRNAAMEDVAVFPYTWCHSNFLGQDLDVASMDFGPIPVQQMEAVLRNMVGTEKNPPILIFRDVMQSQERQSLLQRYEWTEFRQIE